MITGANLIPAETKIMITASSNLDLRSTTPRKAAAMKSAVAARKIA